MRPLLGSKILPPVYVKSFLCLSLVITFKPKIGLLVKGAGQPVQNSFGVYPVRGVIFVTLPV